MPVPLYVSRACRRWKITKTLSTKSSAIPIPLSDTLNTQSSSCSPAPGTQSITTRGASSGLRNFTALPMRFCHNMVNNVGSPTTSGSGPVLVTSVPDSSMALARLSSAASTVASRSTSVSVD